MIHFNTIVLDDYSEKFPKSDACAVLHRIACVFGVLITAFCLLRCFLSVGLALQDVRKYEHTGTFPYFLHFLDENSFSENICMFQLMTAELLLYITQYRRAVQRKPLRGIIWCFTVILILHTGIWLHANSLPSPKVPYEMTDLAVNDYLTFANVTVLPSIVYFVAYFSRIWKNRSRKSK